MLRKALVLSLLAAVLTACGGGGGGGGSPSLVRPTSITGTATPPVAPQAGTIATYANMLLPANMVTSILIGGILYPPQWSAIVQSSGYYFDPAAAPALKVLSLSVSPVQTQSNLTVGIYTGAAYPADPALGQTISFMPSWAFSTLSTGVGAVVTQTNTLAGLPTVTIIHAASAQVGGYVLPYSATMNPAGYTYQTFGCWVYPSGAGFTETYFSTGAATTPGTLPAAGTASYTGQAAGSYVDAATRDPGDMQATMNATVDFAARSVAFSTTGTTTLSNNAALGTPRTANAGLNMSGTLSYAAGNNTFTGAVSTTNGMTGNATGRFYGPGIAVATGTKVAGAPPEIGGTFAVMSTAGAMQGAFAGQ